MSDPDTVNHLTLTTGHLRVSPRAEVSDLVIALLRPVLEAEEGPVPGMEGWFLDVVVPLGQDGKRKDGAAFFQIARETGMSQAPAVMAVACWDAAVADRAWRQAVQGYLPLMATTRGEPLPLAQPPLPWLAVWLTPFATIALPEDIAAFGDLERCVFWTLMQP